MITSAFNTPFVNPTSYGPSSPWSFLSQSPQGLGINPYAFQQYSQSQPLASAPLSSLTGPVSGLSHLQTVPLLQNVPQQLQRLQYLAAAQLQELQQLQQIVQFLPAQLQQLQQLPQHQQPYGQIPGLGGFAFGAPWSAGPQAFGAQPSHVM